MQAASQQILSYHALVRSFCDEWRFAIQFWRFTENALGKMWIQTFITRLQTLVTFEASLCELMFAFGFLSAVAHFNFIRVILAPGWRHI